MASKEKVHISVRSVLGLRNLNWPAPEAEAPCWGTMAADVEVVTTITASIRIISGGNVLLFMTLLLLKVEEWSESRNSNRDLARANGFTIGTSIREKQLY
jgi:hypothetical protein